MRSSHQPSQESRPNRGLGFRIIGFLMVGLGVIVIAAVGAYYGYRTYAHSQLDDLNSSVSGPFSLPPDARMHGFEPIAARKSTTVVGHGSTKSNRAFHGCISPKTNTTNEERCTLLAVILSKFHVAEYNRGRRFDACFPGVVFWFPADDTA